MSQSALRIRSELMLGPLAGWLLMALLAPGAAAQTVPADIAEVRDTYQDISRRYTRRASRYRGCSRGQPADFVEVREAYQQVT